MTEWLKAGNTAVITGGASGIGLAAAAHFAAAGMNVLLADLNDEALAAAAETLSSKATGTVLTQRCDVASFADLEALQATATDKLGHVHCLMNNAGVGLPPSAPWENLDGWRKQVDVNLWGIIHGCQAFIPTMLESGAAGAIINTGSKQGITNPPGNYAYNLSKAGVKAYTESLAHALRQQEGCRLTAHLLVPGFTYTGMIARFVAEKPPGAWTPEQVVAYLLERLEAGSFYVLCPDNETPPELDARRIQWNTDDLLENRSALSRWDPAYADAFAAFMEQS